MDSNNQNQPASMPPDSAGFGTVPKDAESFRNVPHASETFGKLRNDSERFRNLLQRAERKENHSLTVREAARLFEDAGVARTERSIVNWCQPNRQGISRLDAYYDPNERKYYITPQSVETAIQEEKARSIKSPPQPSEVFGKDQELSGAFRKVPKAAEKETKEPADDKDSWRIAELEREVLDLTITNRAKDYFIGQLQKERESNSEQLIAISRKNGELETRLLQIEGGKTENLV